MAESQPKADGQFLSMIPIFFTIAFTAIVALFTSPFRGPAGAPTYKQAVAYAVARRVVTSLSVAQSQAAAKPTEVVYLEESKKQGWSPDTIDLGGDAKGHWIGPSSAKYVMLFYHGGGYIAAATPGHLKYLFALQKAMKDAGLDFSIFAASYSLAPHKVYPGQLSEAVRPLRYLVERKNRDPQTIFIGGDSAGANLTAALMLHLARPHPEVDILELPARLRGAILISPWISFDTSHGSYTTNAKSDYLTPTSILRAASTFIGDRQHDCYSEPIQVEAEWWASVAEEVVDEVMIWGGGGEILIDGIRAFAGTMAEGFAIADASIQMARTSASQRRSMAVAQHLSGVDEAAMKEAHWHGSSQPGVDAVVAAPDASADEVTPAAAPEVEEIEIQMADDTEKTKDVESTVRPSADTTITTATSTTAAPTPAAAAAIVSPQQQPQADQQSQSGDFIVEIDDAATRKRLGTERVFWLETPRASHEEQIMNHSLRMKGKAPSETVIEDWLKSRL